MLLLIFVKLLLYYIYKQTNIHTYIVMKFVLLFCKINFYEFTVLLCKTKGIYMNIYIYLQIYIHTYIYVRNFMWWHTITKTR